MISIIVPVYKAEKYLQRCVDSIIKQTFTNWELILVEDGSPDNSGELCDEWAVKDKRIKVIHKLNGGASSARNAGLAIAQGEYISFVDSDDWINEDMYEVLYFLVIKYDAEMAICNMTCSSNPKCKTTPIRLKSDILVWDKTRLLKNFFRINGEKDTHSVWNRLISKSLLADYRFLNGKMNEDIETCYYLASRCNKAVCTNETLYYYYKNLQGVTRSSFNLKKLDLLDVWGIVYEKVVCELPEYEHVCSMNYKRAYFTLLCQMKLNGYDHSDPLMIETKRRLVKEVRASFIDLMRWKMPISRKIVLPFLCIG